VIGHALKACALSLFLPLHSAQNEKVKYNMKKIHRLAAWLALPLALLLCAQWPLRDGLGAYSREANDLGQVLFAWYGAVAISAATRAGVHLAAHQQGLASPQPAAWKRWALLASLLPWALLVLWAGAGSIWQSVVGLEKFPDTFNPGYFLIKTAGGLLAALVAWDALALCWLKSSEAQDGH
jgi:hypothetical protein